jgi:endonuclease/exonuclease/phosphatase family metal-dependent hydrolase
MNSRRYRSLDLFLRRFSFSLAFSGALLLTGCSAPPKTTNAEAHAPPQPKLAITVRIASVDLSGYGRRIEKKDIEQLSAALKREQIEIFAVQGIARYPNVKTRVDFVNELAAQMDMRHAFGESIDISGRQQGNAVFSMYPIRSNQKKEYSVLSAFYESALQVSIDAGVRDVVVVSTRLPAKASSDELAKCMRTIAELQKNPDAPFVVTGNLPAYKKSRDFEKFTDLQSSLPNGSGKLLTSRLWYMQGDLFRVVSARAVKTDLGTLTVAEFGLYQQTRSQ